MAGDIVPSASNQAADTTRKANMPASQFVSDLITRLNTSKGGRKRDGRAGPRSPIQGKYELRKLLGQGTFAKVYKARNVATGQSVAIKAIDKETVLKTGMTAHVKREISILRRLRHPNIVRLFEVMATKSKIYFVMEYVRGGELFKKVAKGRLEEDVSRKYFQQLISAVGFCHGRGVYHRDLKPENLLVDERGNLKVSDFGLSAVSDKLFHGAMFHTLCGTPAYISPEVLAAKGYDAAKADIWACGVVLFVLMAGHLPFHDRNVIAMYRKINKGRFRCPQWFSPDLVSLLVRLLDTNPESRISILEIMENKWFKEGFKRVKFYIEGDKLCNIDDYGGSTKDDDSVGASSTRSSNASETDIVPVNHRTTSPMPRPVSLNAFDIISFSPGFDLSGLFGEDGEGSRFVSGAPASKIISKLGEIAEMMSFGVRKTDWRVTLEGSTEGVKGPLTIATEIFKLTPQLVVVEVRKNGGDREEYEEFCRRELRPRLESLVIEDLGSESE